LQHTQHSVHAGDLAHYANSDFTGCHQTSDITGSSINIQLYDLELKILTASF
jgi:hypothetical protein